MFPFIKMALPFLIIWNHKTGKSIFWENSQPYTAALILLLNIPKHLHVIDVNSGYKSVSNNQEQNALETNLEAAEEIARQLRLRDIGGIIVVDFIDMKLAGKQKEAYGSHGRVYAPDRAKHAVLPISKFGLMQITRQRMKPEMNINTQEVCPSCNGTGKISSTLLLKMKLKRT